MSTVCTLVIDWMNNQDNPTVRVCASRNRAYEELRAIIVDLYNDDHPDLYDQDLVRWLADHQGVWCVLIESEVLS